MVTATVKVVVIMESLSVVCGDCENGWQVGEAVILKC